MKNYEDVWDSLIEYGVIDESAIFSEEDLIKMIIERDVKKRVSNGLIEGLLKTKKYQKTVSENIKNRVSILKEKKKETIVDGYEVVVEKTVRKRYIKDGRETFYYSSTPRRWTEIEVNFLRQYATLPTKEIIYKFNQQFTPRTSTSIAFKVYRIKKLS